MKIDKDELKDLVDVGLIYEVNNDWKFVHQTIGEFGFNKFLKDNFDDENCAKFIIDMVLVDDSYQIIRSFMDFWITEKVNQKTSAVYQKMLLDSTREEDDKTPLHVASREGNGNIFWFLYSSLAAKSEDFESRRMEIENYLLKQGDRERGHPIAFADYLRNCDDNFNILSKIQSDFGVVFVKKTFTNGRLLSGISGSDRNILKVLIFLRENFSHDFNFYRIVFDNFLPFAFWGLKNETLVELLEELRLLRSVLGQNFIDPMFLREYNLGTHNKDVFLANYGRFNDFNNDFLFHFLDQIRELCNRETFRRMFIGRNNHYSNSLLHSWCGSKSFDLFRAMRWVIRELGKDTLNDIIITLKNYNCDLKQSNSNLQYLSILRFLKQDPKFRNKFFPDQVLSNVSIDGRETFNNLLTETDEINFYSNFLKFLKIDLKFTNDSMKSCFVHHKFLLFNIAQYEKSARDEILKLFGEKFGDTFIFDHFYSNDTLHDIFERYSKFPANVRDYLNFVNEQMGSEFLKNYVLGKNSKNQTVLFYCRCGDSEFLASILEYFGAIFRNDKTPLKDLLLHVDENGDSCLTVMDEFDTFYDFDEIFQFLTENFDKNFVRDLLIIENSENRNCFHMLFGKLENEQIIGYLNLFIDCFGNDRGFYEKLLGEKFRNNPLVEEWMEYNFTSIDMSGIKFLTLYVFGFLLTFSLIFLFILLIAIYVTIPISVTTSIYFSVLLSVCLHFFIYPPDNVTHVSMVVISAELLIQIYLSFCNQNIEGIKSDALMYVIYYVLTMLFTIGLH
jgi:hypothetical protein